MDFGIALATSTESWKVVQRAERLGFSHAWFYDTQLLNPDVFIGMALAAANTSRIRLGTGVLIPSNRIEPVTANALASLNRLAPGRIDFGVGTGFTGRRTMAERAITLDRMKDYVQRVQALLQGEKASWPPDRGRAEIGFLNPELGLINLEDRIDLHVSAMGPKSRRLVAELGAGWLNFAGQEGAAIKTLEDMQGAWSEAGRSVEDLYGLRLRAGHGPGGAVGDGVLPQPGGDHGAGFDGEYPRQGPERSSRAVPRGVSVLSGQTPPSAQPSRPSDVGPP